MSKSKASKSDPWIMCRLKRTTVDQLRAWGGAWMEAALVEMGRRGEGERDQPSLDAIIGVLIDRELRHRQAGIAASKRRGRKALELLSGPGTESMTLAERLVYKPDSGPFADDQSDA